MNAPARTTPATLILRNAAGEPPLGIGGLAFRDDQGEIFFYDSDRSPAARFGILELEDGSWLVHPFHVESVRFADRSAALRFAIAGLIRKTRKYMRAKEDEGIHWGEGLGGRVIEWALLQKPEAIRVADSAGQTPTARSEQEGGGDDLTLQGAAALPISDPVIAGLIAANRARKVYPAGHCFSRTNPVIKGKMKNVATCECGNATFAYEWGCRPELVDAAEEAHWQKFDHLAEKVDGRGQPVTADGVAIVPAKKTRKHKSSDGGVESRHADSPITPGAKNAEGSPESGVLQSGAGLAPGPSEAIQPGTGGLSSVPIIADGASPHHLRSEPAQQPPPKGAGSTLSALRAIASGEHVDFSIAGPLFSDGLVHATTTRISLTEAGQALLKSSDGGGESGPGDGAIDHRGLTGDDRKCQPLQREGETTPLAEYAPAPSETEQAAPIGAGSVADVKCDVCAPDEYLAGIMARTRRLDDLGSVQDGLKMSTDGHAADGGDTSEGERQPQLDVTGGESAAPLSDDDAEFWNSPLIKAALDLAWREPQPVSETLKALLDFSKVYGRSTGEVERPVLRWHGGKWRLAPWIISHFPEHRVYVEPFGGAASVLLRKRRSYAEVYNDLDREVISFFGILQDPQQSARLIELLYLTPFARDEFELGYKESDDPIERARRLVVRAFMGHGSDSMAGVVSGFRANSNKSGTTPAHDWVNYVTALPLAIDRLRGVVIEQRDGPQVMTTHDAETTLHYVDPPYLPETRTWMTSGKGKGNYRHELDPEGHASLLSSLLSLKGMVVLSGYPSELYDRALSDWRRIETDAYADGARPRTEVLWLNPACAAALDEQHPTLFNIPALDVANTPPSDVAGIDA